jgi:ribosomal protein S18 acetylase RimI-like enzyme
MNPDKGGNIVVGIDDNKIVGVVILTNTGMKDFIPENILVYIAVDNSQRGKGYGKQLKKQYQLLKETSLHVEPDNLQRII